MSLATILRPARARRLAAVRTAVALAALSLGAAACNDEEDHDDEPEVDRMVLTIGTSTVTVSSNGTVTGGPLRAAVGANTVTAQFLRVDGTPDPKVTTSKFRLNVSQPPTGVTFAPVANSLNGTLTTATTLNAQTVNVRFELFHIEENHEDFGPFAVSVRVGN